MKMNWGKGLAIAMVLFIGFIVTMVVILINQDVDLVKEDYYQSEMEYQVEIDALKSGNTKDQFVVAQVSKQLVFNFNLEKEIDSIKIDFWRPNNKAMDRSFVVTDAKQFLVPMKDLAKGNYEIRCQFWKDSETYIQEKSISIKG